MGRGSVRLCAKHGPDCWPALR